MKARQRLRERTARRCALCKDRTAREGKKTCKKCHEKAKAAKAKRNGQMLAPSFLWLSQGFSANSYGDAEVDRLAALLDDVTGKILRSTPRMIGQVNMRSWVVHNWPSPVGHDTIQSYLEAAAAYRRAQEGGVVYDLPAREQEFTYWRKIVGNLLRELAMIDFSEYQPLILMTEEAEANPQMSNIPVYMGQEMAHVLAYLKALEMLYQNAHWKVTGETYYGDHLLFDRLYENAGKQTDGLAERIVGYYGRNALKTQELTENIRRIVSDATSGDRDAVRALIVVEQAMGEHLRNAIRANDLLREEKSFGLDDFLMGLATDQDERMYLLRQKSREPLLALSNPTPHAQVVLDVLKYARASTASRPAAKRLLARYGYEAVDEALDDINSAGSAAFPSTADWHGEALEERMYERLAVLEELASEAEAEAPSDNALPNTGRRPRRRLPRRNRR